MPTLTQAGIVTTSQTNVLASSYSWVAAATSGVLALPHTVTIATHNVGNLLVAMTAVDYSTASPTIVATAPSGTGTGSWVDCGEGNYVNGSANVAEVTWIGKVTSVQASTVITVPYTTTGTVAEGIIQILEFSCLGVDSSTAWTVDAHGHTAQGSANAISYPGLIPLTANPEIYCGQSFSLLGVVAAGATPGCFYVNSASNTQAVYDLTVGAPISPQGITSGGTTTTNQGILAYARVAKAFFDNFTITLQPVPSGLFWIISQVGFEFMPVNSYTTITCDVLKNGRAVKAGIDPTAGAFQGPPYINYYSGDVIQINFYGAPVGATVICNFLYNEYHADTNTRVDLGGVV